MTDWTTIASLGTAAGTLILASATFASVRSANKVARVAERSFEFGLRPSWPRPDCKTRSNASCSSTGTG